MGRNGRARGDYPLSAGFTLVELLVVVSIICLMMSIMLPSLTRAQKQAEQVHCLANQQQLFLAWTLYTTDHDDKHRHPASRRLGESMIDETKVHTSEPHRALGRTLGFVLFLYLAWVAAWILERALERRFGWMTTSGTRFAYWTVMKLLLWVLPAVVLIRTSGRPLREVIGIDRVRAIIVWGGGVGLLFAASALITKAIGHQALFSLRLSWPFFGGVMVAPIVEETTFRGAILRTLLTRYRFVTSNTLTAIFFVGVHLPGWYFQGRLWAMLGEPIGGALSIFIIGWVLGVVAYRSKSVAASTLTHVLNNLFNAS